MQMFNAVMVLALLATLAAVGQNLKDSGVATGFGAVALASFARASVAVTP